MLMFLLTGEKPVHLFWDDRFFVLRERITALRLLKIQEQRDKEAQMGRRFQKKKSKNRRECCLGTSILGGGGGGAAYLSEGPARDSCGDLGHRS